MTDTTTQEVIAPGQQVAPAAPAAPLPATQQETPGNDLATFMAATKDMDMAKLEKFMELRDRENANRARAAYYRDFAPMKAELPLVIKKHHNTQTSSNYAKLEDINQQVDPVLGKYGFGTSSKVMTQDNEGVRVSVRLHHKDGHFEETEVYMPLDDKGIAGKTNKTGPHAVASSITYARRVGLAALLGVSTGDDQDGNSASGLYITEEQAAEINTRISAPGHNKENFLQYLGVDSVERIRRSDHDKAIKSIEAREEKIKLAASNKSNKA